MFSDSFKVLEQAFLGRTVIIRSDRQAADNAAIVETFGQANRLCGCICTGTCNDRDAAIGQLKGHHHDVAMLFMAQRCGFAGSPYRNNRRGSVGDMVINQFFQA